MSLTRLWYALADQSNASNPDEHQANSMDKRSGRSTDGPELSLQVPSFCWFSFFTSIFKLWVS